MQNTHERKNIERSHVLQNHDTSVEREVKPDIISTSNKQPLLGIGLAILLATATFFSGLHIGTDSKLEANLFSLFSRPIQADDTVDLQEFWKVWKLLDEKYVDSANSTKSSQDKVYGAIDGLVRSYGDPYTIYMPPEQSNAFEEDISGNFSGVGMEVGIRDAIITVIAPLPGSPAEKAGLIPGDSIIKINGTSTEGMTIDEAVKNIRGEKGTEVILSIFRKGETEFHEIKVVRDTIAIPTSKTQIKDDVFIISLYSFNALSEAEMQNSLREFVKSKKKKLIIDLRGNPGGYLQSAVSIASYFLPTGKIVVREQYSGDKAEDVYRSSGKELGAFKPEKLAILIDNGSASAAEILAGALQEHKVATLIGSQTFGKGSVQELIKLDDGSSLKVTIARWLTPNGISISKAGLTPDIIVERTMQDRVDNKDPQLDTALEFVRK